MRLVTLLIVLGCSKMLYTQPSGGVDEHDLNYDYFSHQYEFIDDELLFNMPHDKFQETVNKYKFYPERIKDYRDSLGVVLVYEFNGDWGKVHVGSIRLGYTWLRLGYHLWLDKKTAEKLANDWGFNHPYKLFEYIYIDDNYHEDNKVTTLIEEVRLKLLLFRPTEEVYVLKTFKEIINYATLHNPVRQADYAKVVYERKHGKKMPDYLKTGVSCGKENCCQTKVK